MDSHLIYTASSAMRNKADWDEWVYCGEGNEVKKDMVIQNINEYFVDSMLYVAWTRRESIEVNKKEIELK